MEDKKIQQIINLNNKFYINAHEQFSKSRQKAWNGWYKILPYIKKDTLSVLDLGCGNGRFYKFLKENLTNTILNYEGLDNNKFFIKECKEKYEEAIFKEFDIFNDISDIKNKYDLVVGFGITHHLPGEDFRINWFKNLLGLANSNGLIVISFWNLNSDKRFDKAEVATDMEKNDFLYTWDNIEEKRYVHIYYPEEIFNISLIFKQEHYKLLDTYEEDGKNKKMNTYIVLKKDNLSL